MFWLGRLRKATDEELLQEFQAGRHRAFEELVHRHQAAVEGFARRLLQNPQLAEEVVADTFERVARERATGSRLRTVRAWLFAIARNRCLDVLRRQRREQRAQPWVVELEGRRPTPPLPEAVAVLGELAGVLEEALARLPESHREVVLLRLVHGLSGEEVAEILGCSEEQVRSQLSYARKAIRRRLAGGAWQAEDDVRECGAL